MTTANTRSHRRQTSTWRGWVGVVALFLVGLGIVSAGAVHAFSVEPSEAAAAVGEPSGPDAIDAWLAADGVAAAEGASFASDSAPVQIDTGSLSLSGQSGIALYAAIAGGALLVVALGGNFLRRRPL